MEAEVDRKTSQEAWKALLKIRGVYTFPTSTRACTKAQRESQCAPETAILSSSEDEIVLVPARRAFQAPSVKRTATASSRMANKDFGTTPASLLLDRPVIPKKRHFCSTKEWEEHLFQNTVLTVLPVLAVGVSAGSVPESAVRRLEEYFYSRRRPSGFLRNTSGWRKTRGVRFLLQAIHILLEHME